MLIIIEIDMSEKLFQVFQNQIQNPNHIEMFLKNIESKNPLNSFFKNAEALSSHNIITICLIS